MAVGDRARSRSSQADQKILDKEKKVYILLIRLRSFQEKGKMPKRMRATVEEQMSKFAGEGPRCLCFNLRKAARAITQLYDEALRQTGLRVTQVSILGVTNRLGPVTVSRLAEATVTDRTTLTRNLKLLEKRGLIRVTTGNDRRQREVILTDRGHEALAKVYPLWKKVQTQVAKNFGEERVEGLLSDLGAVVAATRSG
jgi:DNA-binding MarR family transcriptional regulator